MVTGRIETVSTLPTPHGTRSGAFTSTHRCHAYPPSISSLNQGMIKPGEEVEIVGLKKTQKSTVTGVEMFHKLVSRMAAFHT